MRKSGRLGMPENVYFLAMLMFRKYRFSEVGGDVARKIPTFLTRSERKRLLSTEMTLRNRAIIVTFLYAGLRCNELRMLDVSDIDFDDMTVLIRHGKRSKQRLVPLHAEAAAVLGEYLGDRTDGPVFRSSRSGKQGTRICLRQYRYLVKETGQRAGIRKDVHPHALRHTFAVSLREAGEELDVLKDLLGHSSIKTTEIYTHCSVDQLRSAVDKI